MIKSNEKPANGFRVYSLLSELMTSCAYGLVVDFLPKTLADLVQHRLRHIFRHQHVFIGINLAAPFLMLGIGIDDMFVIVQCWQTLDKKAKERSMVERFGLAMRQAGSAITVTSLTDITARRRSRRSNGRIGGGRAARQI